MLDTYKEPLVLWLSYDGVWGHQRCELYVRWDDPCCLLLICHVQVFKQGGPFTRLSITYSNKHYLLSYLFTQRMFLPRRHAPSSGARTFGAAFGGSGAFTRTSGPLCCWPEAYIIQY